MFGSSPRSPSSATPRRTFETTPSEMLLVSMSGEPMTATSSPARSVDDLPSVVVGSADVQATAKSDVMWIQGRVYRVSACTKAGEI